MPNETSISFAQTKVQPPRFRAGLVERSGLEERLGAALLSRRLVLLIAAAGYGKTVALSRQLLNLPPGCATAWITADEQDDLPRLLACLTEALEAHDPPWRVATQSLVEQVSKARELHAVVAELTNAFAAMPVDHGVIAFDDMHLVADPRVFEFLQLLIERAPTNWSFAIASRIAPPLSLARLRVHHELAEFGASDLSFSLQEIRSLCNAAGQHHDDQSAESLLERTQGWVAGLCLTLDVLSRAGTPTAGRRLSQRHQFDYLASEVFGSMSESWRDFLMRCSVLPELTATRCARVSGNANSARMLEEIEQRGMFVSVLDGEELTLRMHDLFRDFLDDRLRREHAEEIPELLQRAAQDEPDPMRKTDMLLRAGAWREAEELLCEVAPILLAQGDSGRIAGLMERFPADARARSPRLAYVRGVVAWSEIDIASTKHMGEAAAGFEREGDLRRMRRALAHQAHANATLRPHVATSEAIAAALDHEDADPDLETELAKASHLHWRAVLNGPQSAVHQHLARLTELLESGAPPALWFSFFPWVHFHFGIPGARALAMRLVSGALAAAGDGYFPLQLQARSAEAYLFFWQGRVDEAQERIRQLQLDEQWAGRPAQSRFGSWSLLGVAGMVTGDRTVLQDSRGKSTEFFRRLTTLEYGTMGVTGITLCNMEMVAGALAGLTQHPNLSFSYWGIFPALFEARLALHDQRDEDALALLRECVKTSSDRDRFGFDALVRVFLAIAEMRTGSATAAWRAVEPLVGKIRSSGEVLGVLFCGPAALAELARFPWPGEVPREGLAELQHWAQRSQALQVGAHPAEATTPAAALDAPLSAREFEVLMHIAAGDSNKLIARALDLSPHTVKRHVARILDRLDLASRGEAAAWYHRRLAKGSSG
ncbi:ATP-dependent transcriptional activator MalT [Variovorax sp. SRS16]|uniref:helix-turn-helix transcriptional regulator n=1 Tax=Variovorax sp. SRS16 TaxID=282217 RepID=UPI001315D754|nr:LuxR C-terminal-related transcriptional regulator [Variovorax sp. SRS16]VTU27576.1 ATP-dependent transcriptional activator MalT [Variovorax sp. SRS16]